MGTTRAPNGEDHWLPMTAQWKSNGPSKGHPQEPNSGSQGTPLRYPMGSLRELHGNHKNIKWRPQEHPMGIPWDPKGDPKDPPPRWDSIMKPMQMQRGKQRKPETHLTRLARAWPGLPGGPSLNRHLVIRLVRSGWHTYQHTCNTIGVYHWVPFPGHHWSCAPLSEALP